MIIKSKAGNGNKIHVYIDNEYVLTVYDDYWHQNGFKDGETITEEELASLKEEAGFRLAYEKGLDYLTRRSYAKKELFYKLKTKYGDEATERAIEKLSYFGYLNDEEFARMYSKYLFETKKFDVRRINSELKLKGIDREIIENVTKTLDNEPIQRIIEMLSTKFSSGFKDEKTKKRFIAKLQRMGYSWNDIKSALLECEIDIISSDDF
ncbi:MAG: regulatory protein RecX [Clostridia bacterium]|jgi:regulatory protein|nr:regulatory protein RecX [Clostridia bacterium]